MISIIAVVCFATVLTATTSGAERSSTTNDTPAVQSTSETLEAVAPTTEAVYDLGNTKVPGYTCGTYEVNPCDPMGGSCTDPNILGLDSVCQCFATYENRSSYCDWGPIPSTYGGDKWSQEKLKRVLLAYDASNAVYYSGTEWEMVQDGMYSGVEASTQNRSPNSTWLQQCPTLPDTYISFDQFRFQDKESTDDTHVAIGVVRADKSPSGEEELLLAFGGTFSATNTAGEVSQVLTDLEIAPQDLSWKYNGTDQVVDMGYVHYGFYKSVNAVLTPMLMSISYYAKTLPTTTKRVTITGHSLGAAEAVLFGAILAIDQPDLEVHTYTFGTPRVGSAGFVKALEDTGVDQLRTVNQIDIISMVPTSVGLGDALLHSGPQVTLNFTGVTPECSDYYVNNQYVSVLELPVSSLSGCPYEAVKDHLQYKDNIVDWLNHHGLAQAPLACGMTATF